MRKIEVMDAADIDRVLNRIAHEIIEKNRGCGKLAIVGIRTRGVHLAQRIKEKIKIFTRQEIETGIIDITLYRDDLGFSTSQPEVKKTEIPFNVEKKNIVIIDDVLYTGRTIRAAIDVLIDLGRPCFIQLGVLIDRGHRELPIRPDFVGKEVLTTKEQIVEVMLLEEDNVDQVIVRDDDV